MTKTYTIVRFTLVNRRTRAQEPCWIASLSFKSGDGMHVSKMTTTRDRDKAARFSIAQAHEVAAQFWKYPATLERADGTPMPVETEAVQQEQLRRVQRHLEIRREFTEAFESVVPTHLRAAVLKALAER